MRMRRSLATGGIVAALSAGLLFFQAGAGLCQDNSATGNSGQTSQDEYALLQGLIADSVKWDRARLARESFRPDAMLLETDTSPLEVVLRRTAALLADLKRMARCPDLSAETAALRALQEEADKLEQAAPEARQRELFAQATALRRKIAFRNPLLDFDRIIFLKHNKQARGEIHMVDQYLGFNQAKAGGVYVLEKPFSEAPVVRSVLARSVVRGGRLNGRKLEDAGAFTGLDLDYDGKTVAFAFTEAEYRLPENPSYDEQYCGPEDYQRLKNFNHYYFRPESTFHIFKASADGSDLVQLTDGRWDDY
ncbi:MAG: hypothetical protein WCK89_16435, partial [bacterium]